MNTHFDLLQFRLLVAAATAYLSLCALRELRGIFGRGR